MKVKDLIIELQQQDPEKEVMIQQGEDYDYMAIYTIRETELVDMTSDDDEEITTVVIDYT